jgi:hypothetical protein
MSLLRWATNNSSSQGLAFPPDFFVEALAYDYMSRA